MAPKSTKPPLSAAAVYAQSRRDAEATARNSLRALIPDDHFDADVEAEGKNNENTKIMKAAESYIGALNGDADDGDDDDAAAAAANSKGKGKEKAVSGGRASKKRKLDDVVDDEGEAEEAQEERRIIPAAVLDVPEFRQLKQCADRLLAVAERRAASELGVGGEGEIAGSSEGGAAGEGGLSTEVKAAMETGSDLMIDLIERIEQGE